MFRAIVNDIDTAAFINKSIMNKLYCDFGERFSKLDRSTFKNSPIYSRLLKYYRPYLEAAETADPALRNRKLKKLLPPKSKMNAFVIFKTQSHANGTITIVTLADEFENLPIGARPNVQKEKVMDFNIFLSTESGRRLQPEIIVKLN